MKGDQNNEGRNGAAQQMGLPYEPPRLERVGSLLNLLGKTGTVFEFGGEKRVEPPPAPLSGGNGVLGQPGPHGQDEGGGGGHGH